MLIVNKNFFIIRCLETKIKTVNKGSTIIFLIELQFFFLLK